MRSKEQVVRQSVPVIVHAILDTSMKQVAMQVTDLHADVIWFGQMHLQCALSSVSTIQCLRSKQNMVWSTVEQRMRS